MNTPPDLDTLAPAGEIADTNGDIVPRCFPPQLGAGDQVGDFVQRLAVLVAAQIAPQIIVDRHDLMAVRGQMHGCGPAQIAVTTQNENSH